MIKFWVNEFSALFQIQSQDRNQKIMESFSTQILEQRLKQNLRSLKLGKY